MWFLLIERKLNNENGLQEDLNSVVDWCKMSLNAANWDILISGYLTNLPDIFVTTFGDSIYTVE